MSETTGFFVAQNKIPLDETYVAIPSQNGLTYDAQKLYSNTLRNLRIA